MSDLKVRPPVAREEKGRSKLRHYNGKRRLAGQKAASTKADREKKESLLLFGPGRDNPGHAGVGDELAHVFVGVDDDAQVHAVRVGVAIIDVDLALEVLRRNGQWALLDGVERRLSPMVNSALGGDGRLQAFFQ